MQHPASLRSGKWQPCPGLGGSLALDWVAGFTWNGWQASVEYAARYKANDDFSQKYVLHDFKDMRAVKKSQFMNRTVDTPCFGVLLQPR